MKPYANQPIVRFISGTAILQWLSCMFTCLVGTAACDTCPRDCSSSDDAICQSEDIDGDTENDTDTATPTVAISRFPFQISNVTPELEVPEHPGELRFEGSRCEQSAVVNTDNCTIQCIEQSSYFCTIDTQSDGSEIAVIVADVIFVQSNVAVQLIGQRPLVLISNSEMEIDGSIVAIDKIDSSQGVLGGYSAPSAYRSDGNGFGGGDAGLDENGAGGGSYCGMGGNGGMDSESAYEMALGGAVYGNAEIIPLQGGSSGGNGYPGQGGAGGGALQLVAANHIHIADTGYVNVPGNGGGANEGHGGGSGGAMLLESAAVTIDGVVAVNGGAGGSGALYGDGEAGQASTEAALGGRDGDAPMGGNGSSSLHVDGFAGEDDVGTVYSGGGGGGGAGWIRINTADSAFEGIGALSPSIATVCTSTGALKMKK